MLAAVLGQRGVVGRREILVVVQHLTGRRDVEPTEDVEQRRLATPRRPEQHDELAGVEIEVDAAQRMHVDLAHGIDLGDLAGREDRAPNDRGRRRLSGRHV